MTSSTEHPRETRPLGRYHEVWLVVIAGLLPLVGGTFTWLMNARLVDSQARAEERDRAFELVEDVDQRFGPALALGERLSEYAYLGLVDARYDSLLALYAASVESLVREQHGLAARTTQLYGYQFAAGLMNTLDRLRLLEVQLSTIRDAHRAAARWPLERRRSTNLYPDSLRTWMDLTYFRSFEGRFRAQLAAMSELAGAGSIGMDRLRSAGIGFDSLQDEREADSLRLEVLRLGALLETDTLP